MNFAPEAKALDNTRHHPHLAADISGQRFVCKTCKSDVLMPTTANPPQPGTKSITTLELSA